MKHLSEEVGKQAQPAYVPASIRNAKDPWSKAAHFYQLGYEEERCEEFGVSKKLFKEVDETYKGRSIPLYELNGWRKPPSDPADNEQIVGPGGLTYGQWKGVTGPGKALREIISAEKKSSGMSL